MGHSRLRRHRIVGSEGSLLIPDAFYYEPPAETRLEIRRQGRTAEERFAAFDHYASQVEAFNRCVLERSPLPFAPDDAVRNMQAVEAALQSARGRVRVPLPRH